MSDNLKDRMETAAVAAWEAGKVTLRYFQTPLDVDIKSDRTPVTAADREAEQALAAILLREFPQDAFLGEESAARPGSSGFTWIVDPIDGTKSFVQGIPLYGVMVGLEDPHGEVVVGVVNFPALGDLIVAARGEGCTWNGRRARVSGVERMVDACVAYGSERTFAEASATEALRRVLKVARFSRGWGDCYGHMLVATGRADVMLDPVLSDWDCVPLLPILEEAGGAFTDWNGNRSVRGKSGVSTNGKLHAELQTLLRAGEAPDRAGGEE